MFAGRARAEFTLCLPESQVCFYLHRQKFNWVWSLCQSAVMCSVHAHGKTLGKAVRSVCSLNVKKVPAGQATCTRGNVETNDKMMTLPVHFYFTHIMHV